MAGTTNATDPNKFVYDIKFHYQSQKFDFGTWISLFTLCLAPLIAHLATGTPQTVFLHKTRPRWHEQIVHYNPTSIAWRYFAITDRRLRAREWHSVDMAAGNALFWTAHGWDGSAEIMIKSREWRVGDPPGTLGRLFSVSTFKTVVVALQGAQALYVLADGIRVGAKSSAGGYALDTIFSPLAIIGLLRLLAALWLTDESLFGDQEYHERTRGVASMTNLLGHGEHATSLLPAKPEPQVHENLVLVDSRVSQDLEQRFYPTKSVRGIALRVTFVGFFCILIGTCFARMFRGKGGRYSATIGSMGYIYAVFLMASTAIFSTYFVKGRSSLPTTVLPCITTWWYKLYTGFLIAAMLTMIIIASLETRRTPCGVYTTYDVSRNLDICPPTNVTAS